VSIIPPLVFKALGIFRVIGYYYLMQCNIFAGVWGRGNEFHDGRFHILLHAEVVTVVFLSHFVTEPLARSHRPLYFLCKVC
jgi:hypothetical protein